MSSYNIENNSRFRITTAAKISLTRTAQTNEIS